MQTVFLIVHYINLVSDQGFAKFYSRSHDAVFVFTIKLAT
jgi:hypothetical protein